MNISDSVDGPMNRDKMRSPLVWPLSHAGLERKDNAQKKAAVRYCYAGSRFGAVRAGSCDGCETHYLDDR